MKDTRLRAPSSDGALLAVPPLGEARAQFERTANLLRDWDHDFQGRRATHLRGLVHREIIAGARDFLTRYGVLAPECRAKGDAISTTPLVVTGHQPELFHPGVWVKNFATASLAKAHGGLGLNLIVDNDLPKSSTIRVPQVADGKARAVRVEFDQWEGEAPYEDLPVHDERVFRSFRERVLKVLGGAIADPILDDYWPRAVRLGSEGLPLGLRLALARHEMESSWGVCNLEIPLSEVCRTEGFLWFASHILAQLPRFLEIHNRALAEYRAHYGIRSKNHPVAALGTQGEWREAPFWAWRRGQPRRRPLLVLQKPRTMLLRIFGEDESLAEIPLSPEREACCAVEQLRELGARSVRLRTRALTTTMFARYLLGDLFIHGIGGAKYDELGDVVARRFFQIEPPGFVTLSMTLWAGLPDRPTSAGDLASLDHELRDLEFNPDRSLSEPMDEECRNMIRAKREAISGPVDTRSERVARFRAIRAINEALQAYVKSRVMHLQGERQQVLADLAWNRIARNREFSFVVHSASRLRDLMMDLNLPSGK
jgi:hypothetical protein